MLVLIYNFFNDEGTMDGAVAVYNIMLPPTAPQYRSNDVVQKHGGIVWEVCSLQIKIFKIFNNTSLF